MKIPSRTGVTAGVTPSPRSDDQPRGRRRAIVAGLVATGLVSSSLILPGVAAAAVPAAPDNIVVFPNRDLVVLEGFDDLAGQPGHDRGLPRTAAIVLKGTVTGTPTAGAEFEINHPGGLCWGAGGGTSRSPRTSGRTTASSIKFGTAPTSATRSSRTSRSRDGRGLGVATSTVHRPSART